MSLSLTVLGSAGTYPGAGRACSSYLVVADGYRLLLDCGNGSLANLQRRCAITEIDTVVLSHLHHDHWADLVGLHYALRFAPEGPRSVPVYAPPGAADVIGCMLDPGSVQTLRQVCRFVDSRPGDRLELGPLGVTLHEANHLVPTLASRVECDGAVLAYTGDSDRAPQLTQAGRDADLFICDATWLEAEGPHDRGVHMTGADAGRQATEAGARRLLLSHLLPATDPADVAAEAAATFDGDVLIATDLQEHLL